VIYGNLHIIPIESSLLYCVPIYVQASGTGSVPGLMQVIVATGKQIVMRPTLDQAIAALGPTGGPQVAATEETPPEPTTSPGPAATSAAPGTVPDLLRRANTAYQRARQKQREYNTSLDELGRALDDLQRSLGGRR
jgi:uncharacterized membrane protein (UPF0182 family)